MIAADVFGAFEEAGLDDLDKAALVGRRWVVCLQPDGIVLVEVVVTDVL